MKPALFVVGALVALAALACGSPPPPPPPAAPAPPPPPPADAAVDASLDQDLPRLAARSLRLYEELVAAFRAAGEDCAAAAARLGELRATYAEVVAANAAVLHAGRAKELRAALAAHDEQLDAAARAIAGSPTLAACANDAAFTRAFDDLVAPP